MSDHAFDCLVDGIEPQETHTWPVTTREMLHTFGAEGALQESSNYQVYSTSVIGTRILMK